LTTKTKNKKIKMLKKIKKKQDHRCLKSTTGFLTLLLKQESWQFIHLLKLKKEEQEEKKTNTSLIHVSIVI
jgi:hypothetical protein